MGVCEVRPEGKSARGSAGTSGCARRRVCASLRSYFSFFSLSPLSLALSLFFFSFAPVLPTALPALLLFSCFSLFFAMRVVRLSCYLRAAASDIVAAGEIWANLVIRRRDRYHRRCRRYRPAGNFYGPLWNAKFFFCRPASGVSRGIDCTLFRIRC